MGRLLSAGRGSDTPTMACRALTVSLPVVALAQVVLMLAVPGVGGAATHARIGPHQYFAGSINGSPGVPKPAVIRMACPGPSSTGQTGHPASGQPVEVDRVLPTTPTAGYTGSTGTSISVFFGSVPPTPAAVGTLTFNRYGVPKDIPSSLSLPCNGTGVVTFYPFPRDPPISRAEVVRVEFVNLAVAPVTRGGV